MPFKSKAQRRFFHTLKAQGRISQAKLDEWEKDTPADIPEKVMKKVSNAALSNIHVHDLVRVARLALGVHVDDLVALAPDKLEKNARLGTIVKNLAKTVGRGGRYLGEAAVNITAGGKGGYTAREIASPLLKKNLKASTKWDPLHSIKNLGKLHDYETSGPLKGMLKLDDAGVGVYKKLPEGLAGLKQRVKNIPKLPLNTLKGDTPTRADRYVRKLTKEHNKSMKATNKNYKDVSVGKFLSDNKERLSPELSKLNKMKYLDYMRKHTGQGLKQTGIKGLHYGFFAGMPAYDIGSSMLGKGDPTKTVAENVGGTIGDYGGWAMMGTRPPGWILGPELASGLGTIGGYLGRKANSLFGSGRNALTREKQIGTMLPQALKPQRLPQPLSYEFDKLRSNLVEAPVLEGKAPRITLK